jgi:lambda family phage portal protein
MTRPTIFNHRGQAIPGRAIDVVRSRAMASTEWDGVTGTPASYQFPWEASKWHTQEMGNWYPWIRSPDAENNLYRDRMVGRQRDIVRNDGWASGIVDKILDNTIGSQFRLLSKPDYRALRSLSGVKEYDEDWAEEFSEFLEAIWRSHSEDMGRWNDLGRQLTVPQQFRLALRHKLIDGEGLAVAYWKPDRKGYGAAKFATAFGLLDPDRLSNPYQAVDTINLRGGVEIDDDGVPIAYHIRKAYPNDYYATADAMTWERVPREDEDGWQRVLHDFDRLRTGQNRGVSIFAPILSRLKMLAHYYGVELQAAAISATFGTYVTSPYDEVMVQDALETSNEGFGWYQGFRDEWHTKRPMYLNGARVPALAPGEDIKAVHAERPSSNFAPFTHEMLRGVASCLGMTAEQVTQDYSAVNYSSARIGIEETRLMIVRRLADFRWNFAMPYFAAIVGEAMDGGMLKSVLPRKAIPFIEARTLYCSAKWLTAAKGWIDPAVEAQAAILRQDAGYSTLEDECADQGVDWRDNVVQRARERDEFDRLKLPHPQWMGQAAPKGGAGDAAGGNAPPANKTTTKPAPQ